MPGSTNSRGANRPTGIILRCIPHRVAKTKATTTNATSAATAAETRDLWDAAATLASLSSSGRAPATTTTNANTTAATPVSDAATIQSCGSIDSADDNDDARTSQRTGIILRLRPRGYRSRAPSPPDASARRTGIILRLASRQNRQASAAAATAATAATAGNSEEEQYSSPAATTDSAAGPDAPVNSAGAGAQAPTSTAPAPNAAPAPATDANGGLLISPVYCNSPGTPYARFTLLGLRNSTVLPDAVLTWHAAAGTPSTGRSNSTSSSSTTTRGPFDRSHASRALGRAAIDEARTVVAASFNSFTAARATFPPGALSRSAAAMHLAAARSHVSVGMFVNAGTARDSGRTFVPHVRDVGYAVPVRGAKVLKVSKGVGREAVCRAAHKHEVPAPLRGKGETREERRARRAEEKSKAKQRRREAQGRRAASLLRYAETVA